MMKTKPYTYTGTGSAIADYHKPKTELQNIIRGNKSASKNWGLFDKNNKQHRTILSQLRQLQWVTASEKWGEIPDINRLSEFLKSDKSPVNKPLNDMTPQELSKMISCFDSVITKHFK
ncbi:hypothetical protein [Flavobacterium gelatinilyticum]|uniref:hypothetical protein n=1 Tax=Flavobacterium gelatinilyticum TaxID=3003260 RepID=UPI002480424C|nr:hypothetical protein [Flavobacterium gelatinilyticum]